MFDFNSINFGQIQDVCAKHGLSINDYYVYQAISNNILPNHVWFDTTKSPPDQVANPNVVPTNIFPPLTPLMFALARPMPRPAVIKKLLDEGADPNLGSMGKTAAEFMEFARVKYNWVPNYDKAVTLIMKEHGAKF